MAIVSNEIAKALQQLAEAFRTTNGASPISSNDARSSIALASFAQGTLGLLQVNLSETSRTVGGNIEPPAVAAAVEHQQPAPNALGTIDGGGTRHPAARVETAQAQPPQQLAAAAGTIDGGGGIPPPAVGIDGADIQLLAGGGTAQHRESVPTHPRSQKRARIDPLPVVPRAITQHDISQCEYRVANCQSN
jgi:hypothetical protein